MEVKSVAKVAVGDSSTKWGGNVGGSKPKYTPKYGEGLGVMKDGMIHGEGKGNPKKG